MTGLLITISLPFIGLVVVCHVTGTLFVRVSTSSRTVDHVPTTHVFIIHVLIMPVVIIHDALDVRCPVEILPLIMLSVVLMDAVRVVAGSCIL